MAKKIEETLKKCKACKKTTKHMRNSSSTGFVMVLVHLALIIMTAGFWLLALIVWHILFTKIGGWTCSECGK